jgi:hypothetical protein
MPAQLRHFPTAPARSRTPDGGHFENLADVANSGVQDLRTQAQKTPGGFAAQGTPTTRVALRSRRPQSE